MTCRHCRSKKASRPKGLCWSCYFRPGVKELYKSTSKFAPGKMSTMDPFEQLKKKIESNPHWKPCPYHPSDPRYCQTVDIRESLGLPPRHPEDIVGDLV